MRNGNVQNISVDVHVDLSVLTVPMRNGNYGSYSASCFVTERSYRTYEEWKQGKLWYNIIDECYVLTVPMRNGNTFQPYTRPFGQAQFLPYLWGMETLFYPWYNNINICSYRTYEEWKRSSWTRFYDCKYRVLTVPMRNGNKSIVDAGYEGQDGSYRTYEEWKRHNKVKERTPGYLFLPYLWGMETKYVSRNFCV